MRHTQRQEVEKAVKIYNQREDAKNLRVVVPPTEGDSVFVFGIAR